MESVCSGEIDKHDVSAGKHVLHGRPRDNGVDALVRRGAVNREIGYVDRPPWTQRLSEQLRVFGMVATSRRGDAVAEDDGAQHNAGECSR